MRLPIAGVAEEDKLVGCSLNPRMVMFNRVIRQLGANGNGKRGNSVWVSTSSGSEVVWWDICGGLWFLIELKIFL